MPSRIQILERDKYDDMKYIAEYPEFILAKGGDGTLLTAINKYQHLNKPFFGIAAGTVNFLMNSTIQFKPTSSAVYQKFHLLKVVVHSMYRNEPITLYAFNDIVIGEFNGWVTFDVGHKDCQVGQFKGSGMIISTAQGSTGINRNNHGTILPITSPNWSVTGMQTNRTINSVVRPVRLKVNCHSRGVVTLMADGTNHCYDDVTQVVVSKGPAVTVVLNNLQEFQEKRL